MGEYYLVIWEKCEESAVNFIKDNGKYGLLLCDRSLGARGNGDEVIAVSRQINEQTPIISTSGYGNYQEKAHYANSHLPKSYSPLDAIKKINRYLPNQHLSELIRKIESL